MTSNRTVHFDGYSIHPDCALELFVHHLMLAQRLYETVDTDHLAVGKEIVRIMLAAGFGQEEIKLAVEFSDGLWEYYEELGGG